MLLCLKCNIQSRHIHMAVSQDTMLIWYATCCSLWFLMGRCCYSMKEVTIVPTATTPVTLGVSHTAHNNINKDYTIIYNIYTTH